MTRVIDITACPHCGARRSRACVTPKGEQRPVPHKARADRARLATTGELATTASSRERGRA